MINLNSLGVSRAKPADVRFDNSYIPEPMSGCWLWLGTPSGSNGYGRIMVNGRGMAAHRYSYERFIGPIPGGLFVLHHCDNPACVNPYHLFTGADQDNTDDKLKKGRQARGAALIAAQQKNKCKGEKNGNNKLTAAQVQEIRELELPQRKIAAKFNISQALVSKIKRKEMWK